MLVDHATRQHLFKEPPCKMVSFCGQVILVVEDKPLITRDMHENLERVGARILQVGLQDA